MEEPVFPLSEELRIDLQSICIELRRMAIKLKKTDKSMMSFKLFNIADILESYKRRLR